MRYPAPTACLDVTSASTSSFLRNLVRHVVRNVVRNVIHVIADIEMSVFTNF